MRIGLDLDGVVVDSVGRWVQVLNREARTAYRPGDLPDTHGTPEFGAISDRHEIEMAILPGPMAGAPHALAALKAAGHDLVVITARAPRLRRLTEAWLDYHGMAVDALYMLAGGDKVAAARAAGVHVFIEDHPRNALSMAGAGIPVLLFDAPYNRGAGGGGVLRCHGWDAVLAALNGARALA